MMTNIIMNIKIEKSILKNILIFIYFKSFSDYSYVNI
jgi:hypothetical protein